MSHPKPIRQDKTCQNCHRVVENRYCTSCGQENVEVRQSFYHLFVHFFEDFTHYEGSFWKTIRYLITKPGKLTREYLNGKRHSYLNPIKLYIFTSFATFLLLAYLPNELAEFNLTNGESEVEDLNLNFNSRSTDTTLSAASRDSLIRVQEIRKEIQSVKHLFEKNLIDKKQANIIEMELEKSLTSGRGNNILNTKYNTLKELDSAQAVKPEYNALEYYIYKRYFNIIQTKTKRDIINDWNEAMYRNLPKILFIYMPIFAFLLWLFHSKKRWLYFDHGIFTLHYFSFILLMILLINVVNVTGSYLGSVGNIISSLLTFSGWIWLLYYFFPAHHRFYGSSRFTTIWKSSLLMLLNFALISVLMLLYMFINFLLIH